MGVLPIGRRKWKPVASAGKAKGTRPFSRRDEQHILPTHAQIATRPCQALPGRGGAALVSDGIARRPLCWLPHRRQFPGTLVCNSRSKQGAHHFMPKEPQN